MVRCRKQACARPAGRSSASSEKRSGSISKKTAKAPKAVELLRQLIRNESEDDPAIKRAITRLSEGKQGAFNFRFKNGLPGAYVSKRVIKAQGVVVEFDEEDRRSFVSGFRKRKQKRRTYAKFKEQVKQMEQRQNERRDRRDATNLMLKEYDTQRRHLELRSRDSSDNDEDNKDGDGDSQNTAAEDVTETFDNDTAIVTVTTTTLSDASSDDEGGFNVFKHVNKPNLSDDDADNNNNNNNNNNNDDDDGRRAQRNSRGRGDRHGDGVSRHQASKRTGRKRTGRNRTDGHRGGRGSANRGRNRSTFKRKPAPMSSASFKRTRK